MEEALSIVAFKKLYLLVNPHPETISMKDYISLR